jgi:hypothetical protein
LKYFTSFSLALVLPVLRQQEELFVSSSYLDLEPHFQLEHLSWISFPLPLQQALLLQLFSLMLKQEVLLPILQSSF